MINSQQVYNLHTDNCSVIKYCQRAIEQQQMNCHRLAIMTAHFIAINENQIILLFHKIPLH